MIMDNRRGRPLPFSTRQRIKQMIADRVPYRVIVRALGVSSRTVAKYRKLNDA